MTDPATLADDEPLPCPACGYDLRATRAGRCPECGQTFDPATLQISGIPWAHRAEMGRVRAYFKTIWQVTTGHRSLRYEASRPQSLADADRFRRITASLLSLAFLLLFFIIVAANNTGLAFLAIQPPNPYSPSPQLPGYVQDLAVPWSAGATLWPTLPLMLIFLAFAICAIPQRLFRDKHSSPKRQERLYALASYAISPLLLILPAILLLLPIAFPSVRSLAENGSPALLIVYSSLAAEILIALSLFLTLLRIAQFASRARHTGLLGALTAVVQVLALWLAAIVLFLGVLPWCVGFLSIVGDSFR